MTRQTLGANKAFTLIELLVVIAIITILAAILFPVFTQAREKARQTTCVSNQKQIGLAMLQYCVDYDEMMPYAEFGVYSGERLYYWQDAIYPYVKSNGVFSCPDTGTDMGINPYYPLAPQTTGYLGRHQGGGVGQPGGWGGSIGSYMVNSAYWGWQPGRSPIPQSVQTSGQGIIPPTQFNKVLVPSTTLFCMDGAAINNGTTPWTNAFFITWQYGWGTSSTPSIVSTGDITYLKGNGGGTSGPGGINNTQACAVPWHQGRMTVTWCDGHASTMSVGDLVTKSTTNFLNGNGAQPALKYWTIEDD